MNLRASHPRKGSVFVASFVLLLGISVVLIALGSEIALDLRMSSNLAEADQAREIARIGIDYAIYLANANPSWRAMYPSGAWVSNMSVGGGTLTVSVTSPNGNFNCPIDPLTVRSAGTYKGSTRTFSATLKPPVHDSMMFLFHVGYVGTSGSKLYIDSASRILGDISCQEVSYKSGSAPDFRGDIYMTSAGWVQSGLTDADTRIVQIPSPPTLPSVDFNWFISRGSQITPPGSDPLYVTDKLISPTANPYGFSNASGIYYIDAAGKEVKFTRCYITATIVLIRTKKVTFDKACVHSPASPDLPALVTDGDVDYSFTQNLSESESNVDFNGNATKTDVFIPSVTGVIYSSKRIRGMQYSGGTNLVRFNGALVANTLEIYGAPCIFEQDPSLSTNLVNQFQGLGLKLVNGSIKLE